MSQMGPNREESKHFGRYVNRNTQNSRQPQKQSLDFGGCKQESVLKLQKPLEKRS